VFILFNLAYLKSACQKGPRAGPTVSALNLTAAKAGPRNAMMTDRECPQCMQRGLASPHWRAPRFLRCGGCGIIFRYPIPDEAALARLYDRSWELPNHNTDETGATDICIGSRLVSSLAKSLAGRGIAGMRILDYGAGRGAMVAALIKEGADVIAVEPFGCDFLTELGVSVYRDLCELPSDVRFDGIVCLEVIEHLRDPLRVLKRLYERLSLGGWLLITTPNAAGLPARLAGQRWREAAKPGHIVFFTPTTLRNILRDSGFRHIQRPPWFIRYRHTSPLRTLVHFGLQKLGIDGGLRMIAYRL